MVKLYGLCKCSGNWDRISTFCAGEDVKSIRGSGSFKLCKVCLTSLTARIHALGFTCVLRK